MSQIVEKTTPIPDLAAPEVAPRRSLLAKLKPLLLLIAVALMIVLAAKLGVGERVAALEEWIRGLGTKGLVVYGLIYAIGVVFAVPGSVLTGLCGVLFGSVKGTIVASLASTTGATAAFLVSRYLARDSVSAWLEDKETFQKLDTMTERHGDIVVAITRLVPIFPFTLLNYGFGLTKVPLKTYVLWSWLCMLPGTVLYVVGGDAIKTAIAEGRVPWSLVVVAAALVAMISLIVARARKTLAEREETEEG